jgi:hypothetical protein
LLVGPGQSFTHDTVDITVEFFVELESWPDGRASAQFVTGALAGLSATRMIGSGSEYFFNPAHVDPLLVVGIQGPLAESGNTLVLWFGTRLRAPGSATLEALDARDILLPSRWPGHFVAGQIRGRSARTLQSLRGTITLDTLDEYSGPRWGEAKGRITVELGVHDTANDNGPLPTAIEVAFHVPIGFFVEWAQRPAR